MEIIIACWIGSIVISLFIGNVVGIHYLKKLDKDWEDIFLRMKEITISEIKKHTHR